MNTLAQLDPRKAQVVEMRFFGGLSVEETADVLKVSPVTVMRDWSSAKAWLYRELAGGTAMDAERWKQVDRLLHAALERPRDERDAFLRAACVDDEALEREVRSLLAAQEQAGSSWSARPSTWPRAPSRWRRTTTPPRERRVAHRSDHLPLPHRRESGRRRDGRGLQGRGHPPAPVRRAQVSSRGRRAGCGRAPPVPAGGAGGVRVEPSEHLHHS